MIDFNAVLQNPHAGGITTYMNHLLDEFNNIIPVKNLKIYLSKDQYKYYKNSFSFPTICTPLSSENPIQRVFREYVYWNKQLKNDKINLFHSPISYLPYNLKIPSIVTIHDLRVYRYPETYTTIRRQFLKRAIQYSIYNSSKIITVSEFTKNEILDIFTIAWGTFSFYNDIAWEFFRKMSLSYFVSGSIMLEQWLNYPAIKPAWSLLISFKHLINLVTGDPHRFSTVSNFTIGFREIAPDLISNVGTSYGVYHLIGGHVFTIFMTILISTLSYYFFFESIKRNSFIFFYLSLIFLAFGTLSFFCQFISIFSIHEMSLFYILFILSFKFINYIIVSLKHDH